jgi:hypothetical protein
MGQKIKHQDRLNYYILGIPQVTNTHVLLGSDDMWGYNMNLCSLRYTVDDEEPVAPVSIPRRIPPGPIHPSGMPFRLWCLITILSQALPEKILYFSYGQQKQ